MHKKTEKRTILSIIVAFYLAVLFLCLFIIMEVRVGMLGKRNLRKNLVESEYIKQTQIDVSKNMEDLLGQRKVDPAIAKDLVSYETIYTEFSSYIDSVFKKKETDVYGEAFQSSLKTRLEQYLKEHKVEQTKETSAAVAEITTEATAMYRSYVTPRFVQSFQRLSESSGQRERKIAIVGGIFGILAILLLLGMYHYKYHAVSYIIYALIAASILNVVGGILLLNDKMIEHAGVGPDYYITFVKLFITNSEKECIVMSGIGMGAAIIVGIMNQRLRKRSR